MENESKALKEESFHPKKLQDAVGKLMIFTLGLFAGISLLISNVQYLKIPAIRYEIERIPRAGSECIMYGVWNAILSWQFPVTDGYVTRPQDQHTKQSGEKGFSDLHTFHYRGSSKDAVKFLIVQCKRAGLETRPSVWAEGVNQLIRYLTATHGARRPDDRTPVYGTVAIGLFMRVYRYDDIRQTVSDWTAPGVRHNRSPAGLIAPLHIQSHHDRIQRMLNYIRDNH